MKLTLNLASRRYLNRNALNRACLVLLLLLCAALSYQIIGYLQGQKRMEQYRNNIAELEQQLQQLQGESPRHLTAARIEKQQREFEQAAAFLQHDAFRWTALFDRLETLLPAGVSIRSFKPNYKEKSLLLTGVAKRLSDLQTLLDTLLADSFQQVFLQSQGLIDVGDGAGGKVKALSFSLKIEGLF